MESLTGKSSRTYSRLGLTLAFVLLCVGLGSLALGIVPSEWRVQAQAARYFSDAWQAVLSLGDRLMPLAIGAAFTLLGLITLALVTAQARQRRHVGSREPDADVVSEPGIAVSPAINDVAPVSVYLDFENQLFATSQIKPFVSLLRRTVVELTGAERADLFLYCDAFNYASSGTYQALQQYGFRAVDVPHRRFPEATAPRGRQAASSDNLKNFVDFEMALHAHQRALLPPAQQHIFLITTDKDFIPLVRRLRTLGHHVHVWARTIDHEYSRLKTILEIDARSIGAELGVPATQAGQANASAPVAAQPARPPAKTPPLSPSYPTGRQALEQAMTATVDAIERLSESLRKDPVSSASQTSRLLSKVGGLQIAPGSRNMLALLGYDDTSAPKKRSRVAFWLDVLKALGVLVDSEKPLPVLGPARPVDAAALMYGFLQRDIAGALTALQSGSEKSVSLDDVCTYVVRQAPDTEPQAMRNLRLLLQSHPAGYHVRHAQYLCRCAASLGLARFDGTALEHPEAVAAFVQTPSAAQDDRPQR